ncbi:Hypothetical predicted protein [Cloeon dipterum]|uniref:Uncharacterized protein n=1 Tax=Cloeon dipterum TaxID=197152 RepID=A0A8S1BUJ5_9INSE|nr:Hypothetical predicted protein [Cloeon dipterum]
MSIPPPRHPAETNGAATTTLTSSSSSSISSSTPASSSPSSTPVPPPTTPDDGLQTSTLSERELLKVEFFKTYDVMTGVRIAATLGGFFSLMIFLVIYKSKCSRGAKSVASEAAVEMDVVSELPYDAHGPTFCSPRISLGNMSAPAASLRTRYSHSSYVNMLNFEPKSLPGSVMGWPSRSSHQWSEPSEFRQRASLDINASASRNSSFLTVPGVRLSSTGSSSDSSYYLEHRSLMELGLPPPMVFAPNMRVKGRVEGDRLGVDGCGVASAEQRGGSSCAININVIQATPDISPCSSEKQLNQRQRRAMMLAAPLASCGSATLAEDARSIGSDSVFYNDDDWLGSDDGTLCDDESSCSDDCSECSSDENVCVVARDTYCSSSLHSRAALTPQPTDGDAAAAKQGPNDVLGADGAAAAHPRTTELSSRSSNKVTTASSLGLDQLASKVDGSNELISETVF